MRTNPRTFPEAEVVPESMVAPLALERVFGRFAPVEADLGSGDGTFLLALAAHNPERNFLGVEQMPGRVRRACRKIGAGHFSNARVLHADISHALNLLPCNSIDVFHLMFPDPWPKRRHQRRRVVTRAFLRAVTRALIPKGILRIKTDQEDYFSAMHRLFGETTDLVTIISDEEAPAHPMTTFEKSFRDTGLRIYCVSLRNVCKRR